MDYLIHTLIDSSWTQSLVKKLLESESPWEDGKKTAGSHAARVKDNRQLNKKSNTANECCGLITERLRNDPLIKSFCLPRHFHGIMFSRTGEGQGYGEHVDNAYMSSGRSDLSFTVFLNDPSDYEGGELCIQNQQGNEDIKLSAGQIVVYPSTSIHSVKRVSKGERIACVGWVQSYIASNEDRLSLFGLDAGAKGLLAKNGSSPELALIFQSYNNFLRRLGD